MMNQTPYIFDEFFASGKEEAISPFLKASSRKIAQNLSLKASLLSALLLLAAFFTSFYNAPLSSCLVAFVYFIAGTPALIDTIEDLRNFEINIDVLMTLAAFLSVLIGSELEGALLLVLFDISGAMEIAVGQKTKGALHKLNEISPHFATVVDDRQMSYQKSVREIAVGTRVIVKAGEIVPLDGLVIEGSSFLNLVHLTGESLPVSKKKGDSVQAGSRNLDGTLVIEITKTSSQSTLSRIIKLIGEAQNSKPKLERLFDRFSRAYAMTIIALAGLFALTLPFVLSIPFLGTEGGLYRALAFLIAASPCALIIATPTAYLSSLSACAKKGILLKGGIQLDALATCDALAFDKTGTLTTGALKLIAVTPLTPTSLSSEQALAIAAALERHITHPISQAICEAAQNLPPESISDFRSVSGFGLEGVWQKQRAVIGNPDFIQRYTPLPESFETKEGQVAALLFVGDSLFSLSLQDELRPDIGSIIADLKRDYALIMLTGDHEKNAALVAKALHIEDFHANLRPDDKLRMISELSEKYQLAMVGDGINDAPALARAQVGISMGKIGSDTAIDASDIVILNDDLSLLRWLCRKAHHTVRIVRQNLTLALAVIVLATTPALLGFIPLWLAVILHEGGTVIVGLNSLRLLKK